MKKNTLLIAALFVLSFLYSCSDDEPNFSSEFTINGTTYELDEQAELFSAAVLDRHEDSVRSANRFPLGLYFNFGEFSLWFTLISSERNELPTGTYEIVNIFDASIDWSQNVSFPSAYPWQILGEDLGSNWYASSGTITVSKQGSDYRIELTLEGDGINVNGFYEGPLNKELVD